MFVLPYTQMASRFASLRQMTRALAAGLTMAVLVGCEAERPLAATPGAGGVSSTGTDDNAGASTAATADEQTFSPAPEGKVLRHAVFFSFKDDSTPEDIQGVADAFDALPGKIEEITDFEWGTNNSPEEFDDGFTHCFLLSFKDEAGRAAYLPHPAHSGEFADALRPHMKDVFVIDYWGDENAPKLDKKLRHMVFFKFKEDADPEAVRKVEDAFAELPAKIESIKAFEWGTNNSPETHDDGFTHCFVVTFDSEEGREEYLPHPDHKGFVEVLMPVLDKVRVLDFWAQ